MKPFLRGLLLAWLWAGAARAQSPDTLAPTIERLPAQGLLLNDGWRYHAGHDPAWARPDLNDSRWDTLDPTRPRRTLPASLRTGPGWLRLHLALGDSLRLRTLLLQATYLGASELYLNGRLLRREGGLRAQPSRVQPAASGQAVTELPAAGSAALVLAVRLAPWRPPFLPAADEQPLYLLRLLTEPQLRQQAAEAATSSRIFYCLAGVFLLLTLLHAVFFHYNPAQRANRYFARYALAMALFWLGFCYLWSLGLAALGGGVLLVTAAMGGLLLLSGLWVVRALYALFESRPGWFYTSLWVGAGVALVVSCGYVDSPSSSLTLFGFTALTAAEQLRLTGRALRRRQRGAGIIAAGFALALLPLLAVVAGTVLGYFVPLFVALLLLTLIFLSPALGISLFLAREFALDSELLQVKLREVEQLSAQTLAQEQDKQALLASQNERLEQQVQQRTQQLQHSLTDLRATQAQLVQKEKMASLGELTAGIAHEIQNPLNFVNNFAEVSTELLTELKEAQATGAAEEVAVLADDLTRNLEKITQHGQRAAAIVHGMLEHSRANPGERQPLALNTLCEEYLRLAYQGRRAKDKTFNATLQTDFAAGLPLVEGVGADLGRVLLNLFSNAFYAVQQRQQAGQAGYQPTVSVATRQAGEQVEIRVSDNGPGMSPAVQAKLFQPFFTTKPSGEGTGLGLSLSYDIIAQGHGGTLSAESEPGRGTTFTITLPC
ncbi:MAG: ATP-binding protein [Janthinobacterium lividum]